VASLGQARSPGWFLLCAMLWLGARAAFAADTIEFLTGAKLEGRVVAIDKEQRVVEFEATIAGTARRRKYAYDKIHRVVWGGKEYEVTKRPGNNAATPDASRGPGGGVEIRRSADEVRGIIDSAGRSAPDWLASTTLAYPKTLDLDWPVPPPQPWNSQKNVGQYLWDRINPNARQWQSGVRFMYYLLSIHTNDPVLRKRIMGTIGGMYFRFFQDYPRAAFWWQEAGASGDENDGVSLAECYFRLGSREMASTLLRSRPVSLQKIKLLGTMGDTDQALQMADSLASWSQQTHEAYLIAGDICRASSQFERAIEYYRKVLAAPAARNEDYSKRYRGRAEDSIEFIKRFELLDIGKLADGVYRGTSLGYQAPVQIEATIKAGRIERVEVTQHGEKQYYSAIRDVPAQIIQKQSLKDVDATSRATITAVAIINATAKALTSSPQP